MSTVTRLGQRKKDRFQQMEETPDTQPAPKRKPRRWRLAVAALMLVTLLWLLPGIVAHSRLFDWILAKATAKLNGTVTVESASLGWFSPIVAEGIEVRDAQDQPVLRADALRGEKSLAAILWNSSRLGQFRLEQPKLTVVMRDGGSNVEDVLANYLTSTEEAKKVSLVLKTDGGSVSLTDQGTGRTWQIEQLELALSISADDSEPLKLDGSATIPDPEHPGRFAVGLTIRPHAPGGESAAKDSAADQPAAENGPAGGGQLTIQADAVPLAMFQSLAGRFAPHARLAGRLSSKEIHVQWGEKTAVRADVTGDDLLLAAPPLGTDQVQLKHLHAACQFTRQGDQLEIKPSSLDCDLGSVSVAGTLQLGEPWTQGLPASALQQTCEINGRISLARLAQVLPNTLRIRKETQITGGQVQLALSSRPGAEGMVWQGRIEASDLTAVNHGRQLAWERPILVTMVAYDSQQGPVVESLNCESDFLKLHAAGTLDDLAASASFNLKRLADQLGQFVDLGGLGLAGDGWAHSNWKRSQDRQFEADAQLQVRDFQLVVPRRQPWVEEDLLVSLSASGQTDFGADTQLQAATLKIQAGPDRIHARLTRPVLDFTGGGNWPVEVKMQGQLKSWPARIAAWIDVDDLSLAGAYQLAAQATGSTDGITVRDARLTVEQLQLAAPGLKINEPNVELLLCGGWDHQQRRLQVEPATLTSSSLSIQANRVVLAIPEEAPPQMAGIVKFQGDLQRLRQWFAKANTLRTWRIAGKIDGTAQLSQSAGRTGGQLEANVANLVVTSSSGKQFREPHVYLIARGDYEHQATVLRLEQLQLTSGTLGANAAGRIAQIDDQTNVQLDGQIAYDLEKVSGLLQPYLGEGIRIAGSGSTPVSYRGPLSPAGAEASATLGWKWANVYGFPVGPGDLKATLADGILQVQPLDLTVSRGRVLLAPRVRLAPEPMELTLPRGPLAQQVQITPAMCNSALKYIAPVLAGVTTAQGGFSIELDGCQIPLDDPAKGELAGKLTIHSVEVGPGPLVRELTVLLGRASPAKLRRESVVPFRMVQGRIYHRGLELVFPDLTVRTHGSVGLDQTLAVMAEMPVPAKWLGNNVAGSALRNQTIRLPIGGTLNKPRIDRRALDQLTRQFLEKATRNVIETEVSKGLERLFGPPR